MRETCHEEPGGLNAFIDVEDTFDPSVGASSTGAGAAGQEHEEERVAPPAQSRAGSGCRSTSGAAHASEGCRSPRCKARTGPMPYRRRQLPRPAARAAGARSRVAPRLAAAAVQGLAARGGDRCLPPRDRARRCALGAVLLRPRRAACVGKLLCVPSVSDDILEPAAAASVAATNGSAVAFSNTFGRGLSRVGPGDCSWWADFAPLPPKLNLLGGSSPLPIVAFVVCDTILFALASFIRLLLTYLGVETCSINDASAAATLPRIASLFYGALLLLNLVLLFAAVGMILAWHVLGGATQPLAFLPDYAIVLSVIVLTQAVGSSMFRAARSLHDGLLRAFLHTLQPHLQAAYHRAQFQLSLQRAAAVGKHLARPSEYIDSAEAHAAAEEMHNLRAEIEAAERQALLTGDTPVLAPPQAYVHGRMADETRGRTGGYAGGYAAGRILQPVDIYLVLAGDGREASAGGGVPAEI